MQTISIVIQRVNNAYNLETVVDSRKLDEVCKCRESKKMSGEDSFMSADFLVNTSHIRQNLCMLLHMATKITLKKLFQLKSKV